MKTKINEPKAKAKARNKKSSFLKKNSTKGTLYDIPVCMLPGHSA